jgi:chromosomal replication initiation ATPase DnaA
MVKGATHSKQWSERVQELTTKGMISDAQKETLIKMITSPDKENFILAQEILKAKMSDKLIEGLNEDQTIAFAEIVEFFADTQEDAFVLKGYAGTGKTYLVKRIIEYITASFPARRIAVTAPTNKAVQVLQANAPFNSEKSTGLVFEDLFKSASRMEYMTIHKLLGLKEQITASGQQLFKADGKNKSEISRFKYLIVDEVSMLDDQSCSNSTSKQS